MGIQLHLQNLATAATNLHIREFFQEMHIPAGGVHILGGKEGNAFISFCTDDDLLKAMMKDGEKLCGKPVRLSLASPADIEKVTKSIHGMQNMSPSSSSSSSPSRSPLHARYPDRSRSRSPLYYRSRSRSPQDYRSYRSPSPRRYHSPSPRHYRSPSPRRYRSPSPRYNRSPSPRYDQSLSPRHYRSPSPRPYQRRDELESMTDRKRHSSNDYSSEAAPLEQRTQRASTPPWIKYRAFNRQKDLLAAKKQSGSVNIQPRDTFGGERTTAVSMDRIPDMAFIPSMAQSPIQMANIATGMANRPGPPIMTGMPGMSMVNTVPHHVPIQGYVPNMPYESNFHNIPIIPGHSPMPRMPGVGTSSSINVITNRRDKKKATSNNKQSTSKSSMQEFDVPLKNHIAVSNLSKKVSKEHLRQWFIKCNLTNDQIVLNNSSDCSTLVAHIHIPRREDVLAAFSLQDCMLLGLRIKIRPCTEEEFNINKAALKRIEKLWSQRDAKSVLGSFSLNQNTPVSVPDVPSSGSKKQQQDNTNKNLDQTTGSATKKRTLRTIETTEVTEVTTSQQSQHSPGDKSRNLREIETTGSSNAQRNVQQNIPSRKQKKLRKRARVRVRPQRYNTMRMRKLLNPNQRVKQGPQTSDKAAKNNHADEAAPQDTGEQSSNLIPVPTETKLTGDGSAMDTTEVEQPTPHPAPKLFLLHNRSKYKKINRYTTASGIKVERKKMPAPAPAAVTAGTVVRPASPSEKTMDTVSQLAPTPKASSKPQVRIKLLSNRPSVAGMDKEALLACYLRLEELPPEATANRLLSWFKDYNVSLCGVTLVRDRDGKSMFAYTQFPDENAKDPSIARKFISNNAKWRCLHDFNSEVKALDPGCEVMVSTGMEPAEADSQELSGI